MPWLHDCDSSVFRSQNTLKTTGSVGTPTLVEEFWLPRPSTQSLGRAVASPRGGQFNRIRNQPIGTLSYAALGSCADIAFPFWLCNDILVILCYCIDPMAAGPRISRLDVRRFLGGRTVSGGPSPALLVVIVRPVAQTYSQDERSLTMPLEILVIFNNVHSVSATE